MAEALIEVKGYIKDLPSGSRSFNFSLSNADSPYESIQQAIIAGNHIITKPTKANGVVIAPDADATGPFTLKGQATDSGIRISTSEPTVLTVEQGSFTFVMAGTEAGKFVRFVFF